MFHTFFATSFTKLEGIKLCDILHLIKTRKGEEPERPLNSSAVRGPPLILFLLLAVAHAAAGCFNKCRRTLTLPKSLEGRVTDSPLQMKWEVFFPLGDAGEWLGVAPTLRKAGCTREGASSAERSVRLTGPRHLTVAGSGEAEPPDNGVHVRDKKRLASFFITSLGVASLPGALPEALLLSPARNRVFFDWWEEQNKARHDISGPGGSTTPWEIICRFRRVGEN